MSAKPQERRALSLAEGNSSPLSGLYYQFDLAATVLGLEDKLRSLLEEPEYELHMRIPLSKDDGSLEILHGYRVQHNSFRGPYNGGVRYHPSLDRDQVLAQAISMTWKAAVANLPFGGAAGGIAIDPSKLSPRELQSITRSYTSKADPLIGPHRDILGLDMSTSEQIVGWMMDEYGRKHGYTPGIATGKPLALSGSAGRREAAGRGIVFTIAEACAAFGFKYDRATAIVNGFSSVGSSTALSLHEAGCRVLAVSDSTSCIYAEEGLNIPELLKYIAQQKTFLGFPGSKVREPGELFQIECDIVIAAASADSVTSEIVRKMKCRIVAEAANGACTRPADEAFQLAGIHVLPDILCNAGGVTASYFEWAQNLQKDHWSLSRMNEELRKVMTRASQEVFARMAKHQVSLRTAAYILAIDRVAKAARLDGI